MQVLKLLRRLMVVLIVLSIRVTAGRDISCDGRDFQCEGADRYITCIYLPEGQRLYKSNQCDPGTVCNSNNLPSEPCDLNSVPSSTISTAPTSTADRATTLREPSTLPYVRPTTSSRSSSNEVRVNRNSTEPGARNTTLSTLEDPFKLSFGVNISGDMDILNSTSTNVTTSMSVESPSTIKTSAKVVFEKPENTNQTNWQGPIVNTNTMIENVRKQSAFTRISINTQMETFFRFPLLQTQNVITFSNMQVTSTKNSTVSINVATDIAGAELSSDTVAVTTNTTVSFNAETRNKSIAQISGNLTENHNNLSLDILRSFPQLKGSRCSQCNAMKCIHNLNSSSNVTTSGLFDESIDTTPVVTKVSSDDYKMNRTTSIIKESPDSIHITGEWNDEDAVKIPSVLLESDILLSNKQAADSFLLNPLKNRLQTSVDSSQFNDTTISTRNESTSANASVTENSVKTIASDLFQIGEGINNEDIGVASVDASNTGTMTVEASNNTGDILYQNFTIGDSFREALDETMFEMPSRNVQDLQPVGKINVSFLKAASKDNSTSAPSPFDQKIVPKNVLSTSKSAEVINVIIKHNEMNSFPQTNVSNTTKSDAIVDPSSLASINQSKDDQSTIAQNNSTIIDLMITNHSTKHLIPVGSLVNATVINAPHPENIDASLNSTILNNSSISGKDSVSMEFPSSASGINLTANIEATKISNYAKLTPSGHNVSPAVEESYLSQTIDGIYELNKKYTGSINKTVNNLTISEPLSSELDTTNKTTDSHPMQTISNFNAFENIEILEGKQLNQIYTQNTENSAHGVVSTNFSDINDITNKTIKTFIRGNETLDQNNTANSAEVQFLTTNDYILSNTTKGLTTLSHVTEKIDVSIFDPSPTTASAENMMSQNYVSLEEEGETTTLSTNLPSSDAGTFISVENFTDSYSPTEISITTTSDYVTTERGVMVFEFRTPATMLETKELENTNKPPLDGDDSLRNSTSSMTQFTEDVNDYLNTGVSNGTTPTAIISSNSSSKAAQNISSGLLSQFPSTSKQIYVDSISSKEFFSNATNSNKSEQISHPKPEYGMSQNNKKLAVDVPDTKGTTISPNWPDLDLMRPHPAVFETTFSQSEDAGNPLKNGEILINIKSLGSLDDNKTSSVQLPKVQESFVDHIFNSSEILRSNVSVANDSSSSTIQVSEKVVNDQALQKQELENLNDDMLAQSENTSTTLKIDEGLLAERVGQSTQNKVPDVVNQQESSTEGVDTGRNKTINYSIPADAMAQQLNVAPDDVLLASIATNELTSVHIDDAIIDPTNLSNATTISSTNNIVFQENAGIGVQNVDFPNNLQISNRPPTEETSILNQKETVSLGTSTLALTTKTPNETSIDQLLTDSTGNATSTIVVSTTSTEISTIISGSSQISNTPAIRPFSKETTTLAPLTVSAEQAALAAAVANDHNESFPCSNHGVYPDQLDCRKYHLCVQQRIGYVKITGFCAPRSAFSADTQRCVSDVSVCYKKKCVVSEDFADTLDNTHYFSCKEVRPGVFQMLHKQCPVPLVFISVERKCGVPTNFSDTIKTNVNLEKGITQTFEETTEVAQSGNSSNTLKVLIEQDFKEMRATTTVYETAFVESFPVNDVNNLMIERQGETDYVGSNTEPSMRAIRSTPSFECFQEGVYSNPVQCTEFYMCVRGQTNDFTKILRECPPRYAFHDKTKSCSRDLSVCPQLWCRGHGNFPHPNDESSYYRCVPNAGGGFRIYHIRCEHSKKFVPSENACASEKPTTESSSSSISLLTTDEIGMQSLASRAESKFGRFSKRSTTEATNDEFQPKEEHVKTVVSENYRKEAEDRLRGILNEMRDEASRQYEAKSKSILSEEKGNQNSSSSSEEVLATASRSTFECQEAGRFADSSDCKKYFICSRKKDAMRLHHLECRGNDRFDAKKRICVEYEDVHCA